MTIVKNLAHFKELVESLEIDRIGLYCDGEDGIKLSYSIPKDTWLKSLVWFETNALDPLPSVFTEEEFKDMYIEGKLRKEYL